MAGRFLVTGADGFIGSHLVEQLVRTGYAVRALVQYNSFGTRGWLDHCQGDVADGFEDFSGDVRVQTKNGIWRPMTKQHGIAAGTRIETGKTGRIVLRQKSDVVTVTPNTQLTIPKKGKNNVLLTFGRVLFDMERRPDRRFSVGTSHLVAVVKGTRFAVEADNEASTVQLTKGAVQVTAFKADRTLGDTHLMEPGQIVDASKGGNGKLTIINKKSWKAQ